MDERYRRRAGAKRIRRRSKKLLFIALILRGLVPEVNPAMPWRLRKRATGHLAEKVRFVLDCGLEVSRW